MSGKRGAVSRAASDASVGMAILAWAGLSFISGESLVSCVVLIISLFWGLPKLWKTVVSQTFESTIDRNLMILAALFLVLAIFSLL